VRDVTTSAGVTLTAEIIQLLPAAIITAMSVSFLIVAIVTSITVRNVLNAIVYQRRRVLALWQLAGMTDRQMVGILRAQVALLSIAAFVLSAAAAALTAGRLPEILRAGDLLFTPLMSTWGVWPGFGVGALVSALICVLAVRGVSKELRAISPLEAIRSEGVRELPMDRRRWRRMIICGALAVFFNVTTVTSTKMEDATNGALLAGMLSIVAVTAGGPLLMIGLVRAWTRIVPEHLSGSWFLARKTLIASTSRCVASAGSIAVAVFLFTGMFSLQTAGGEDAELVSFVLLVGLALAISVTGSVVLVFMAGQQREREIHLAELAGATPAQQIRQALFEAVIVVVTGSGIGLFLSAIMIAVIQPALAATSGTATFAISWGYFAGIVSVLLVLNILATIVPTMIAQAARDRIAVPE
jgi:ABC-type antimicrobial peptide transport system permease subunit